MRPKIGLALGSGGARGLAHLGVIQALTETDIPIDYIAGTSMGAIIGAMYAQNPDLHAITRRFISFLNSDKYETLGTKLLKTNHDQPPSFLNHFVKVIAKQLVITIAQARQGVIKSERLMTAIEYLIADGDIQETRIPFCAVATDLNTGKTIVFDKGNIREAVLYSSSIPGFIPPHGVDSWLLVDGAVTAPLPVKEVRQLGADLVIAVNVGIQLAKALEEPNMLEILARVDTIRGIALSDQQMQLADIQIRPEVKDAHWSEFERYEEFIQAGLTATRTQIPVIKQKLTRKPSFFQRFAKAFQKEQ